MQSSEFASLLREAENLLTLSYRHSPSYYDEIISILDRDLSSGHLLEEDVTALRDMKQRLINKKAKDLAPSIGGGIPMPN